MTPPVSLLSALTWMLWELEGSRLSVALAPSQDPDVAAKGGKIRVVEEQNPAWYRELCACHLSTRKRPRHALPDTRIRRQTILRLLRRMSAGLPVSSQYAAALLAQADEIAARPIP